jgi:hypothetical protein
MKKIILSLLFLSTPISSSAHELPLKLNGRFNLEMEQTDSFREVHFKQHVRLDINTKRVEGWRGIAKIEAASRSSLAEMKELALQHRAKNDNRFIFGQTRQPFGLESEFNRQERLALSRTAIYRKLGAYSFVGRNTTFGYEVRNPFQSKTIHGFSIHSADAFNFSGVYQFQYHWENDTAIRFYNLIQATRRNISWSDSVTSTAHAIGFHHAPNHLRIDAEIIIGKDPLETEFHTVRGEPKNVIFSTAMFGGSYRLLKFQPFLIGSFIFHEISSIQDQTQEILFGTRYHVHSDLHFGLEMRLARSSGNFIDGTHPYQKPDSNTGITIAARYFF